MDIEQRLKDQDEKILLLEKILEKKIFELQQAITDTGVVALRREFYKDMADLRKDLLLIMNCNSSSITHILNEIDELKFSWVKRVCRRIGHFILNFRSPV